MVIICGTKTTGVNCCSMVRMTQPSIISYNTKANTVFYYRGSASILSPPTPPVSQPNRSRQLGSVCGFCLLIFPLTIVALWSTFALITKWADNERVSDLLSIAQYDPAHVGVTVHMQHLEHATYPSALAAESWSGSTVIFYFQQPFEFLVIPGAWDGFKYKYIETLWACACWRQIVWQCRVSRWTTFWSLGPAPLELTTLPRSSGNWAAGPASVSRRRRRLASRLTDTQTPEHIMMMFLHRQYSGQTELEDDGKQQKHDLHHEKWKLWATTEMFFFNKRILWDGVVQSCSWTPLSSCRCKVIVFSPNSLSLCTRRLWSSRMLHQVCLNCHLVNRQIKAAFQTAASVLCMQERFLPCS